MTRDFCLGWFFGCIWMAATYILIDVVKGRARG